MLLAEDQITSKKELKPLSLYYNSEKTEILSIIILNLLQHSEQKIMI